MDIFSEHDENILEKFKIELRQFMEGEFDKFMNDEQRLERLTNEHGERFRASGKMGIVGLTKE